MTNAAALEQLAQTFAAKQLASIEALSSYADECGIGMSWAAMTEIFEGSMDGILDALGLKVSEPHRDLFAAVARTEFYGALASVKQRHMWTLNRLEALSEIEAERVAA
jgi:hypothetical protein